MFTPGNKKKGRRSREKCEREVLDAFWKLGGQARWKDLRRQLGEHEFSSRLLSDTLKRLMKRDYIGIIPKLERGRYETYYVPGEPLWPKELDADLREAHAEFGKTWGELKLGKLSRAKRVWLLARTIQKLWRLNEELQKRAILSSLEIGDPTKALERYRFLSQVYLDRTLGSVAQLCAENPDVARASVDRAITRSKAPRAGRR